jgi:hypothetical protein
MGAVLSLLVAISVYVYLVTEEAEKWPAIYAISASAIILLVISLLFSSMTITVTETKIKWSFAFGFWKKECLLSDIAEAKVVQNSFLHGFGIRLVGNGWLYNVSGLSALELKLKSGSVIRLGTDEPEYLHRAVTHAAGL